MEDAGSGGQETAGPEQESRLGSAVPGVPVEAGQATSPEGEDMDMDMVGPQGPAAMDARGDMARPSAAEEGQQLAREEAPWEDQPTAGAGTEREGEQGQQCRQQQQQQATAEGKGEARSRGGE